MGVEQSTLWNPYEQEYVDATLQSDDIPEENGETTTTETTKEDKRKTRSFSITTLRKLGLNETIELPQNITKLQVVLTFVDKPYALTPIFEENQHDPDDDIYFHGQMVSKQVIDTKSVTKYKSILLNFETEVKLGTNYGIQLFGLNRSNNKINQKKLNKLGPAILGKERSEIPNMVDKLKLEKALKNFDPSNSNEKVTYMGNSYPKSLFNKFIVINKKKDNNEKLTKSEQHLYGTVPGVDLGVEYLLSNHCQNLEKHEPPAYLNQKYPHYELIELDFSKLGTNHVDQLNFFVKLPLISKQLMDQVNFINARRQGSAKTTITTKKIAVSTEFMVRIYDVSSLDTSYHVEIANFITQLDLNCHTPQQLGVMYKLDSKKWLFRTSPTFASNPPVSCKITCCKGTDLYNVSPNNIHGVFMKLVCFGQEKKRTKSIDSLNPEWNESFEFPLKLHKQDYEKLVSNLAISLTCCDTQQNDTFIGMLSFSLLEIFDKGTIFGMDSSGVPILKRKCKFILDDSKTRATAYRLDEENENRANTVHLKFELSWK